MKLKLALVYPDGTELIKMLNLPLTDMEAEEYTMHQKVLELFRDYVYREGKWDDYRLTMAKAQQRRAVQRAMERGDK